MMPLRPSLFGLFALLLSQELAAQPSSPLPSRGPLPTSQSQSSGVVTYTVTKGDSVLERHTVDPNEEVRVIVQFQTPPLTAAHLLQDKRVPLGNSQSTLQSQIASDHTRFRSDLARLEEAALGAKTSLLKAVSSRLRAEYQEVFNGVALSTRRWLADRLRAFPYVKAVFSDRPVRIQDSVSNHQVGADQVWAQYGATGDSVRIGVLDTGIDYMHPDLGAGFGPGHKVAGGWDFVNNDPDPADDNGHGTHVAGIIAANGPTLKGVAPHATLYAYKVLNAQGWGESSTIIAALERAADPDGDPTTDDHLDVVNLSLGAYGGDPTDPVSQAVDNTTRAGVLCVASAGNNGPVNQSIGSPGCASGALTVGACDATDQVAFFSSRGPTNVLFTIKPDLVAPGVAITSTVPGGSYQAMSGTSMAAPHATGAAALLRQLHRDWSPEMLKSALMGGAKDLGQGLWSQSMGRLDVLKAAQARLLASPQTLSFGLDLLGQPRWSVSDTLTVINTADSARSFTVSGTTGLPAGFTLRADATSFALAAHEARALRIALEVDNSAIQIPTSDLQDVTGVLMLSSGQDSLRVPWAVVLESYLDIAFPSYPAKAPAFCHFTRFSDSKVFGTFPIDTSLTGLTSPLRMMLPVGTYEVVLQFSTSDTLGQWKRGRAWVVRDSVVVNPAASIMVSESDACYRVGAMPKDEQGLLIDSTLTTSGGTRLTSKRTGVEVGYGWFGYPLSRLGVVDKVSPLSSTFVYDYYYTTQADQPKVYTYAGEVSPVAADCVTDAKPGDLVRRDVEYRTHGTESTLKVSEALGFTNHLVSIAYGWDSTATGLMAPFHQQWYALGHPVENFPYGGVLVNHRLWFDGSLTPPFRGGSSQPCLVTPNQAPGADGVLRSSLLLVNSPVQESRGKQVTYGVGPHHYFGCMANLTPTSLTLRTNTWPGMFLFPELAGGMYVPLFLNQAMDFEPAWFDLLLRDSTGQVVGAGTSQNLSFMDVLPTMLDVKLNMKLPQASRFTLQVRDGDSYVLSLKGAATVWLTFDTRLTDRNPPSMTSFNIFGPNSEYTDMLLPGEQGTVEFRVSDPEGPLNSVTLFYHTDSSRAWQSLPLNFQGDLYRAQLPLFSLHDRLISLRVLAVDGSGNSLDYQAEPALQIGTDYSYVNRAPLPARPTSPDSGGTLQLYSPAKKVTFSWHPSFDFDGWDTLSYTFHIRGGSLGTTLDRWCRDTAITLDLMGALAKDEVYRWWVETADGHLTVWSDTATFRTSSTVLAAPGEQNEVPKEFALAQNYPNPFNPSTTIRFDLPRELRVSLKVYNMLGQEVRTLVDGERRAGRYTVELDGAGLASGVYIYRLLATPSGSTQAGGEGGFTAVKKFVLLR